MGLVERFEQKIEPLLQNQKFFPKKIAVAVSGGADSLALTLLLDEFCKVKKIKLFAITVDHKMRETSAKEAFELHKILSAKKISHQILALNLQKIPEKNIEAKLREARYGLLYEFCTKNKIEFLFLGHQLEDVAENFLIRLFRGSGLDGLSSIAEVVEFKKIKIVRPLLDCSKDELKKFLQQKKTNWFEDESNLDEKFLRNKIRKFFNSFPDKNLIQKRIKKSSDEIAKMRDIFDEEMLREANEVLKFDQSGFFLLNLERFQKLEEKIALKILALVLMEISGKAYKPRLEKLKNFYNQLLGKSLVKPYSFYGCIAKQQDEVNLVIFRKSDDDEKGDAGKVGQKTLVNFSTVLRRIFG